MSDATCVFDLENDGQSEMLLFLEPEGCCFSLPPGAVVQVHLFGTERPVVMRYSSDERGRTQVSFWPEKGEFELFFQGRSVWDQV